MRNVVGAFVAVVIGSILIVIFMGVNNSMYPPPFDVVWFLIEGGATLNSVISIAFNLDLVIAYVAIWLIMGLIVGLFSVSKGNTIRTAVWIGIVIALLSILSALLQNPSIWFVDIAERNSFLLAQFIQALPTSLLSVPTAMPVAYAKGVLSSKKESIAPEEIRTRCECGAVYKSKPMLCAECGRVLHDWESDTPTQEPVES